MANRVKELTEKRTQNAKHFLLEDGTYEGVFSVAPEHYKDDNGDWQDIDTYLESLSGDPNFTHKCDKHELKVKISRYKTPIAYGRRGKEGLTIRPLGSNSVSGTKSGNTITYVDAYPNTDVRRELTPFQLKEDFTLKSAGHPSRFEFAYTTTLAPRLEDGCVIFASETEDVYWIQPLRCDDGRTLTWQLDEAKKTLAFDVPADISYPFTIDPSVAPYAGANNAAWYASAAQWGTARTTNLTGNAGGYNPSSLYVGCGYGVSDYTFYRASFPFATTIPATAGITSVVFSPYVTALSAGTGTKGQLAVVWTDASSWSDGSHGRFAHWGLDGNGAHQGYTLYTASTTGRHNITLQTVDGTGPVINRDGTTLIGLVGAADADGGVSTYPTGFTQDQVAGASTANKAQLTVTYTLRDSYTWPALTLSSSIGYYEGLQYDIDLVDSGNTFKQHIATINHGGNWSGPPTATAPKVGTATAAGTAAGDKLRLQLTWTESWDPEYSSSYGPGASSYVYVSMIGSGIGAGPISLWGETGAYPDFVNVITHYMNIPQGAAALTAPTISGSYNAATDTTTISWADIANEVNYEICTAPDNSGTPGTWSAATTLSANTVSKAYTTPTDGKTWYRVRGKGDGANYGDSPWSDAISVDTTPAAPTGLTATWDGATNRMLLSWSGTGTAAYTTKVEVSQNGGSSWSILYAATSAAATTATHSLGTSSTGSRMYRVSAITVGGTSVPSATASANIVRNVTLAPDSLTTVATVAAPTLIPERNITLSASPLDGGVVTLSAVVVDAVCNVTLTPSPLAASMALLDPAEAPQRNLTVTVDPLTVAVTVESPTLIPQRNIVTAPDALDAGFAVLPDVTVDPRRNVTFAADVLELSTVFPEVTVDPRRNLTVAVDPLVLAMTIGDETVIDIKKLAAPTGVFHTYDGNQVTVSWDEVENAVGYRVEVSSDRVTWSTLPDVLAATISYVPAAGLSYYRIATIGDEVDYGLSDPTRSYAILSSSEVFHLTDTPLTVQGVAGKALTVAQPNSAGALAWSSSAIWTQDGNGATNAYVTPVFEARLLVEADGTTTELVPWTEIGRRGAAGSGIQNLSLDFPDPDALDDVVYFEMRITTGGNERAKQTWLLPANFVSAGRGTFEFALYTERVDTVGPVYDPAYDDTFDANYSDVAIRFGTEGLHSSVTLEIPRCYVPDELEATYDPVAAATALTWVAVPGVVGYVVEYAKDGIDNWTALPQLIETATTHTFVEDDPTFGIVRYRVHAVGDGYMYRDSVDSAEATITTIPLAPANLSGSYDAADDHVELAADVVVGGLTYEFFYERFGVKSGDETNVIKAKIATLDASAAANGRIATTFVVPNAENGVGTYTVRVITKGGTSLDAPTIDVDTRPVLPSGLTAHYDLAANSTTVTVTAFPNVVNYHWYRENTVTGRTLMATTQVPTWTHVNPRYGMNRYWVVVETLGGSSDYCTPVVENCTRQLYIASARRLSMETTRITFNLAPVKAQAETPSNWAIAGLNVVSATVQTDTKVVDVVHDTTTTGSYTVTAVSIFGQLDEPLDPARSATTLPLMTTLIAPVATAATYDPAYSSAGARGGITIRWTNPNTDPAVQGFTVWHRNGGIGDFVKIADKLPGASSHVQPTPPAGLNEYRIRAEGNNTDIGWSTFSNTVSVTPTLAAPTVTATPNQATGTIVLSATSANDPLVTYTYFRSVMTGDLEGERVPVTSPDTMVGGGTLRYYARAHRGSITSALSEPVDITPVTPDTPVISSVAYDPSLNANRVVWTNVENESGYRLEVCNNINVPTPTWQVAGTTEKDVCFFDHLGPTSNSAYYYRVTALNSLFGNSSPSATASYTPTITAPTVVGSVDDTTGIVTLTATPPAGLTPDYYSWFVDNGGVLEQIAGQSGVMASYTLADAGTYLFYCKVTFAFVTSALSLACSVTAQRPTPPTITSFDTMYADTGYVRIKTDIPAEIFRTKVGTGERVKVASGITDYVDFLPENQSGTWSFVARTYNRANHYGESGDSVARTVTVATPLPPNYFFTTDGDGVFGFAQPLCYDDQGNPIWPEKVIAANSVVPSQFHVEVYAMDDARTYKIPLGESAITTFLTSDKYFVILDFSNEGGAFKTSMNEDIYVEFVNEGNIDTDPVIFRYIANGTYRPGRWIFMLDVDVRNEPGCVETVLCYGVKDDLKYNSGLRGLLPSTDPLPDPPTIDPYSPFSIQLGRATIRYSMAVGATGYRLYRSKDGGTATMVGSSTGFEIINNLGTEADLADHVYTYYVTAYNSVGESRPSSTVTFHYQRPGRPSIVKVDPTASNGAFTLTITDPTGGRATNYKILKNGQQLMTGGDVNASSIAPYTYIYSGNKIDATIDIYSVVAYNGAGQSQPSDEVTVTNRPPTAPTVTVVGPDLVTGEVLITATPTDARTADYVFYRRIGASGTWTTLNATPQTSPTYRTSLPGQGDYYYAVAAHNIVGYSAMSAAVRIDAPVPTDLTFLASFSDSTGWVTMTATATSANTFTFYRKDVATGIATRLETNDTGIKLDAPPKVGQWVYYCDATNTFGSTRSIEMTVAVKWTGQLHAFQGGREILLGVKATTINFTTLNAPVQIDMQCTEKGMTNGDVVITVVDPFQVSNSSAGPWSKTVNLGVVKSVKVPWYVRQTELVDKDAALPAIVGDMAPVSVIFDETVGDVTNLAVDTSKTTTSSITLTWASAFNAISYEVWYKSSVFDWTLFAETTALTAAVGNLASGTNYTFKVRAVGEMSYGSYTPDLIGRTIGGPQYAWQSVWSQNFDALTTLPANVTLDPSKPLAVSQVFGAASIVTPGLKGSAKAMSYGAITGLTAGFWDRDKLRVTLTLKVGPGPLSAAAPHATIPGLYSNAASQRPFTMYQYGTTGKNPNNYIVPTGCVLGADGFYRNSANGYLWAPAAASQLGCQYAQPGQTANYANQSGGMAIMGNMLCVASTLTDDPTQLKYGWAGLGVTIMPNTEYTIQLTFNHKAYDRTVTATGGGTFWDGARVYVNVNGTDCKSPYGDGGWILGTWVGAGYRYTRSFSFGNGQSSQMVTLDDLNIETEVLL